jgi:hypothetical protein
VVILLSVVCEWLVHIASHCVVKFASDVEECVQQVHKANRRGVREKRRRREKRRKETKKNFASFTRKEYALKNMVAILTTQSLLSLDQTIPPCFPRLLRSAPTIHILNWLLRHRKHGYFARRTAQRVVYPHFSVWRRRLVWYRRPRRQSR